MDASEPDPAALPAKPASYLYPRHGLVVRITHWINVVSLTVLLMSGLMIFNAHPMLDWGDQSYSGRPPVLSISARRAPDGHLVGVTRVMGHEFDTTGWLGVSGDGNVRVIGFPGWITIPDYYSLARARLWHFFFAWVLVINGLAYIGNAIVGRHLRRDLWPDADDWRGFGRSVVDHLAFRHPKGEAARRYNVLQKLAYLAVIFLLLPLIVLAGWAMSPWLDSLWPGWAGLLGGRQSARTLHFIVAWLLVAFVAIHVFEVIVSGLWNHLRSMITGRYRITPADTEARHD